MDIDTPSACQEFQLLQPLGLLRGGGGVDLTMNKVFFVFVFSSRAFRTRVLSFFSIKKCWEKEQLEQPQLAGKQLFEQFPVI